MPSMPMRAVLSVAVVFTAALSAAQAQNIPSPVILPFPLATASI